MIDRDIYIQDAINRLARHFLFLPRNEQREKKFDNKVLSRLENSKKKILPVEKISLGDESLFQEKIKEQRPIILTGKAATWPCMEKWTPEYFQKKYGTTEIQLLNPDMRDQSNLKSETPTTTLHEIIDCMLRGDTTKYARFSNLMHTHSELKDDIDVDWFKSYKGPLGLGAYYSWFLGAKGTKTNLHAACSHNLFCQVYGRKKWTFISPDYDCVIKPEVARTPYFMTCLDPDEPDTKHYPAFNKIQIHECILEPGDILYNPGTWWHKVTNLDASIGFGFRWFDPVESFKLSPTQTLQFIGAMNPSVLSFILQGKNFSKVIKKTK